MLLLAILNGFTGYSMPDDLLSGTGLRIAYSVAQSIPVVGTWVAFLFFGGEFPASETIGRLYISHVLLVPVLLGGLIGLHLLILIKQKHAQFPGPGRTEHNVVGSRLWPGYAMRSLALLIATFGVILALGGLVQINPVWLYGPFDPSQVSAPAQPDWYIGWGDGALRLFPPADLHLFGHLIPSQFWPGALLPGLSFTLLYLWPFLEARLTGDRADHQLLNRPRDHPVWLGIGVGALTFYGLLLVAGGSDLLARWADLPITGVVMALRFAVLGVPVLVNLVGWLLARALRHSDATGLGGLSRADLRAAIRRRPHRSRSAPRQSRPPPRAGLSRNHRRVSGPRRRSSRARPRCGPRDHLGAGRGVGGRCRYVALALRGRPRRRAGRPGGQRGRGERGRSCGQRPDRLSRAADRPDHRPGLAP
jgi:ubiquinol-cytochrome c reductase cytochrome b subunit